MVPAPSCLLLPYYPSERDLLIQRVMRRLLEKLEEANRKHGFLVVGASLLDESIMPLGHDTKVLSALFEMLCRPLLQQVAKEFELDLVEPETQNQYPDFTLCRDQRCMRKLAIDVKSTYILEDDDKFDYTLGSFTSFIRDDETKNIVFPFSHYTAHLVIGFVYKRVNHPVHVRRDYSREERHSVPIGYSDVRFFVQEKWRIAGERAGSGNTTNIGSIAGRLDDFANPSPLFRDESEFLAYWRAYGRTAAERSAFRNLAQFRALQVSPEEADVTPPVAGERFIEVTGLPE